MGQDSDSAAGVGRLSTRHGVALVVASMVGTGVFTTSGFVLGALGSRTLVAMVWLVAGLLALLGALVYAELGAMMPRVGGEYVYLSRAFHPAVGFVSGFVSLVVGFAAPTAAGASAFSRYLATVVPGVPPAAVAALLILVLTALHAVEVERAGRLQTAAAATTLGLIALLGACGLVQGLRGAVPAPALASEAMRAPSVGGFAVGLVLVSYSYFGWNAAGYVAGEMRNPQRALPRALLLGCGLVTAGYVAFNAILLWVMPASAVGKVEIAHLAAEALFGPTAAQVLSLAVCFALGASVSALLMTGPRVTLAMAEDGLFFSLFRRRNRNGAPTAGVLLQGALALVLCLSATFEALLTYVGFVLSLVAAATVAGALVRRRREPRTPRPFRPPFGPLPGLLYCCLSAGMAAYAIVERPAISLAGGVTLAVGLLLYLPFSHTAQRRSGRSDQTAG